MLDRYTEMKQWRKNKMEAVSANPFTLNEWHDEIIRITVKRALDQVQSERGAPPAPFVFFLMGSGGRFEQGIWSDQDHGLIFHGGPHCQDYFLTLGKEIAVGLDLVGYELCDGNVMASNPMWCQSIHGWKQQISDWLTEASWTSLRYFSTFFDSRGLIGDNRFLHDLKDHSFSMIHDHPELFLRFIDNVDLIKKGIGVFGQLLPEFRGEQSGQINIKQTTFFPYVNALRLLALKEKIDVPSTLSRFQKIKHLYPYIHSFEPYFIQLLYFRLHFQQNARSYQQVHFISLDDLSKKDKKELKWLMRKGHDLFSETKKIIEDGCSRW